MATETAGIPLPKLGALKIRVDRVYGKITLYPVCERAKLIAAIAGTTTLTNTTLAYAERLGFDIVLADTTLPPILVKV